MRPLIVANWKMNPPSLSRALALARAVARGVSRISGVEVIIAPPFPYLPAIGRILRNIRLGAQNAAIAPGGAVTGEVSAAMLKDLGVSAVLIGHSERRRLMGESEEHINAKVLLALKAGLTPIIAVGEERADSRAVVPASLGGQLTSAIRGIPKRLSSKIAVAYEPVWAIGTGKPSSPDNAETRAIYIRKILARHFGAAAAIRIRVLYGGSVTPKNAASFISRDIRGTDGLLVGGASLDAGEFVKIVQAVAALRG